MRHHYMKNIVKTACYFVLALCICQNVFAATTAKRSITLWGTKHALMSLNANNECEKQYEIVAANVRHNPEAIEKSLPNFILGLESVTEDSKNARIFSSDDQTLKIYTGLYVHAGVSINDLRSVLTSEIDPRTAERYLVEMVGNFYGYFTTTETHGDPLITEITRKIIERDRQESYFQKISGDVEFMYNLGSPIKNFGPGVFQLMKSYGSGGSRSDIEAKLPDILDAYITFSRKVAQEYFNKKIKIDEKKYNILIDHPGSLYHGKPIFNIATPEVLFSKDHILGDLEGNKQQIHNHVLTTWRDHFMARNIINLIKTKPQSNLLIWFGQAHMEGIVRQIMLDKGLSITQKSEIKVATQITTPTIACDANKILNSMIPNTPTAEDEEKPYALDDWYANYGLKDLKHTIIVYTLDGKKVYVDPNYSSSIARQNLEPAVIRRLKSQSSNQGAYFVRVQTSQNLDLDLQKIVLMN